MRGRRHAGAGRRGSVRERGSCCAGARRERTQAMLGWGRKAVLGWGRTTVGYVGGGRRRASEVGYVGVGEDDGVFFGGQRSFGGQSFGG